MPTQTKSTVSPELIHAFCDGVAEYKKAQRSKFPSPLKTWSNTPADGWEEIAFLSRKHKPIQALGYAPDGKLMHWSSARGAHEVSMKESIQIYFGIEWAWLRGDEWGELDSTIGPQLKWMEAARKVSLS